MAENEGEAANGRADVAASAHQSDMPVPSMEPAPSGVQMPSLSSQADAQGMEGTGDMGDASSQGGMPHPDMEEGLTQRGTQGESMEGIGLKRVLVEVRIPRSENASFALETAGQLNVPGFRLDSDYQPVPATPTREHAAQLRDADEQAVLVRGEIEESRIPELEAQPDVIRVWLDTPIAPFSAEVEAPPIELGEEEAPHLRQLNMAVGPCPIPPCDCQPSVAKGTIGDVAQYLGADQIWALGRRGLGITVGVVDGGITADGRPVKPGETSRRIPRVTGGWPTADWGTEASDWGEHGNMCSTDVLGMAPEAEIYDIRIAGVGTAATISNALAGFQWAIDQHQATGRPHILSNSWGIFQEAWDPDYATNPNHPFTRKVVEALNEGILILFAAGNCGGADCADGRCGSDTGPGRDIWGSNGHPRVMTVGAVNINEQFIGYSSRGPAALDPNKPDFCSISHFQGYFGSDSGTSAATPIAAGVVALLKQSNPSISQEQLKIALRGTARDIGPAGWDQHTGAGILRGAAAYNSLSLGRLEVFARGGDHSLWHIWQTAPNDGWSSWASLGGWIDAPTVTRNTDGRLEAFVIGANNALWHIWQTTPGGGWSSWASLGGWIDMTEVGQNADGRLEVFACGGNGGLWHIWQTTPGGGWSSWASLGGWIDQMAVGANVS